jgi:drug/metabolite transporter (DMT)-like permease
MWGMSFLFIKVGDEELQPLQVALGRMICGSVTLLLVLAVRRENLPRRGQVWLHLAVASLLVNVLPYSLFAYGETHVTSVLAGIWNATTPLFTLLVAMLVLPEERPTRDRVAGLLIGFAGVLVILGVWQGLGSHALLGNLACLAAASCYGLGFPYTRKFLSGRPESVVALSGAQLLCGTLELALITPLVTAMPVGVPFRAAASVAALGALGTGVAFILNYRIIRAAGATTAATVTYVIPLFSTLAGVTLLGEGLSWNQPLGAVVVILGVAASQGRFPRSRLDGRASGS